MPFSDLMSAPSSQPIIINPCSYDCPGDGNDGFAETSSEASAVAVQDHAGESEERRTGSMETAIWSPVQNSEKLIGDEIATKGTHETAKADIKRIKRKSVSTPMAHPSLIKVHDGEPEDATAKLETHYAAAAFRQDERVDTPPCSASGSCRRQPSPCRRPSARVAAVQEGLRRERSGGETLEVRLKEKEGEAEDLELRLADSAREIERLHAELLSESDRHIRADESDERPTSKRSTPSGEQEPLIHRIRSRLSLLSLKAPRDPTQSLRDLESQNSCLRAEVRDLERAVDKWFLAFESEKSSYEDAEEKYLLSAWAVEALERKRREYREDVGHLVRVLRGRDEVIGRLEEEARGRRERGGEGGCC